MGYIMSIMTVLEGQVFNDDIRVAMNCCLCLSIILGWEKELEMQESRVVRSSWYRLIVEEMAMSLAVPCLASKSFINYHKPAVHLTVALLKLEKIPGWIRAVFDDVSISCITENLKVMDVTPEMVLLFRALLNSGFLKAEHIASLNHVFQVTLIFSFTYHEETKYLINISSRLKGECRIYDHNRSLYLCYFSYYRHAENACTTTEKSI